VLWARHAGRSEPFSFSPSLTPTPPLRHLDSGRASGKLVDSVTVSPGSASLGLLRTYLWSPTLKGGPCSLSLRNPLFQIVHPFFVSYSSNPPRKIHLLVSRRAVSFFFPSRLFFCLCAYHNTPPPPFRLEKGHLQPNPRGLAVPSCDSSVFSPQPCRKTSSPL